MLLSTYRLKVLSPVFPVAFFPCSYLLHDISWAALVSLTVTAVVAADGGGVVLLFPQLSVNELLHHRARQGTREYVDENDRLYEQNLPHFWILPLTRFSRKNKTSQRSLGRKETTIQPAGGRSAAPDPPPAPAPPPPYPRRPPLPSARTSAGPLPAPSPRRSRRAVFMSALRDTERRAAGAALPAARSRPSTGRKEAGGRARGGAAVFGAALPSVPLCAFLSPAD